MELFKKSLVSLFVLALLAFCSGCTKESRYVVEYDFSTANPEFISEADFENSMRKIGLKPFPVGDIEDYDYSITFSLNQFEAPNEFCSLDYTIYYRDTMNSVGLEVTFDGPMNQEKFQLGFRMLNQQLYEVLRSFPS